jgi:hypothetical protein
MNWSKLTVFAHALVARLTLFRSRATGVELFYEGQTPSIGITVTPYLAIPNAIASLRQRRSDEECVFDAQDWMHVPLQRCAIILTSHKPARINTITKTKAIAFTTMRCR